MNFIKKWFRRRDASKGKIKLCLVRSCCEIIPNIPERRFCDECRKVLDLKCSECESDANVNINGVKYCNKCDFNQYKKEAFYFIDVLLKRFQQYIGFDLPPAAMRKQIQSCSEYDVFKILMEDSILEYKMIEEYVKSLLENVHKGEQFYDNDSLAFLAVALEDDGSSFARKYLNDLANLDVAELSLASRVAKECIKCKSEINDISMISMMKGII